jgi:hypothetical protein
MAFCYPSNDLEHSSPTIIEMHGSPRSCNPTRQFRICRFAVVVGHRSVGMAQSCPHGFAADLLTEFGRAHMAELVGVPMRDARLLARDFDTIGVRDGPSCAPSGNRPKAHRSDQFARGSWRRLPPAACPSNAGLAPWFASGDLEKGEQPQSELARPASPARCHVLRFVLAVGPSVPAATRRRRLGGSPRRLRAERPA